MKIKNTFLLTLLFSAIFVVACTKDKVNKKEPNEMNQGECQETISFGSIIQPLIIDNCSTSGCHTAAFGSGGYVLETHAQISANADIMIDAMRHNENVSNMPQGSPKLADSSINHFDCWMSQGKLNN